MKSLFKPQTNPLQEEVDAMMEKGKEEIDKAAYENGRHYGLQEMPSLHGDKLPPFILDIKTKCEHLALKVLQKLKPALHMPQGKIDANWADMHHQRLEDEIKEIDKRINLYGREIGSYSPAEIDNRKWKANLISFGLFITEVVLNTQAFAVFGDNLLYCTLLACSTSFAIGLGAHFAGRQYKDAKTTFKRRVVVIVSFISMTVLSSVIAYLRNFFLKTIGMDINPMVFTFSI